MPDDQHPSQVQRPSSANDAAAQTQKQQGLGFDDPQKGDTQSSLHATVADLIGGEDTYAVLPGAKGVLKKANEAVVMTPVNGDLIFLSRKTFNVLLYHAQQQGLRENNRFGIPYLTLKRDAGFNSNDAEMLKDRFRNLIRTTIEWGWIGDNLDGAPKRVWSVTALLADAYFETKAETGELWLYWSYSETLKQQLLESRQYTKLSLAMMARLRSLPALSLYEIGARYATSPGRVSKKAPWEDWVAILRGKPLSDYPTLDYRRFKRETLTLAKAQVNAEQNEFELEWKEYKQGKRVTHLQLLVKPRGAGQGQPDGGSLNELRSRMDLGLFNRMLAMGINQYAADAIYGSCDENALRAAIEQVEARMGNRKLAPLNSVEAYLKECIRTLSESIDAPTPPGPRQGTLDEVVSSSSKPLPQEEEVGYGTPKGNKAGMVPHSPEDRSGVALTRRQEGSELIPSAIQGEGVSQGMAERLALIKVEYDKHVSEQVRAMHKEATDVQRVAWRERFEADHLPQASATLRQAYDKNGLKSPMVSSVYFKWLAGTTWDANPSQMELIEFGMRQGIIKIG